MTDKSYITIDGFEDLTEQEVFDIAVKHIAKTRRPSMTVKYPSSGCQYSGSGCNAAPFIQEDLRIIADDIGYWGELVSREMAPMTHFHFMNSLQACHDDPAQKATDEEYQESQGETNSNLLFMRLWKDNMYDLARGHNLDTSELDKVTV